MAQINVRKRGKTWEYRFEIASIDGKRKQKSKGGFRTKAEALKAGTDALAEYNNTGTIRTDSNISFADLLDTWYQEYVEPNLTNACCNNYKNQMEKRIKPALGSYHVNALTHSTLQQFLNSLQKDLKKNSIKQVRAIIKGALKYACINMGIIKYNPASEITVPQNADKGLEDVGSYDVQFIQKVLNHLKGEQSYYAVLIASKTGMRIGEIFALEWSDIDFDQKVISVTKNLSRAKLDGKKHTSYTLSTPKTKTSTRRILVDDELISELKKLKLKNTEDELFYGEYYREQYLGSERQIVTYDKAHAPKDLKKLNFIMRMENGGMYLRDYLYARLKKMQDELGINFKFHNLRHSHATILIEQGVSPKTVQDRLGHANISTTLDLYVDATDSMKDEAVHALEKAWTNGGQNKQIIS